MLKKTYNKLESLKDDYIFKKEKNVLLTYNLN